MKRHQMRVARSREHKSQQQLWREYNQVSMRNRRLVRGLAKRIFRSVRQQVTWVNLV